MSDNKNPNEREMHYPMESKFARHPNSPAASGARPPEQSQPKSESTPTEEVQRQWAGRKGPAEAGKP